MSKKYISALFTFLRTRDSKTIDLYFEALNVVWFFSLWSPDTTLALDLTKPIQQYLFSAWIFIMLIIGTMSLVSKRLRLRLFVLMCYIGFYCITGINLLLSQQFSLLSGFFICQAALATVLSWKIHAREVT